MKYETSLHCASCRSFRTGYRLLTSGLPILWSHIVTTHWKIVLHYWLDVIWKRLSHLTCILGVCNCMCNKWKIPLVRIIHHTSQSHQPKISWEGANDPNAVDLYFFVLGWQPKKKHPGWVLWKIFLYMEHWLWKPNISYSSMLLICLQFIYNYFNRVMKAYCKPLRN